MNRKHQHWGWVFVAPYVAGLLIFFLFPVATSIYYSFTSYDLFNPPQWVGLQNWASVLRDPVLWKAVRNVLLFTVIFVPSQTILACIFAVGLNQKLRAMKLFRVCYFLPVVTPWVGAALVWQWLYNPQFGALNYLLKLFGLGPFDFTMSTHWYVVVISIAVVNIWKGVGYVTVILLAGLQNISNDVLEAASIDGAGARQKFTRIILPLLSPTIFLVLILGTMSSFQVFDAFYVMLTTAGTSIVNNDVTVLNVLIYENAFVYGKLGIAATIAWVSFAFVASITLFQRKMESRWVHYA